MLNVTKIAKKTGFCIKTTQSPALTIEHLKAYHRCDTRG